MINSEAALQVARERRLLINEFDAWLVEEISPFLGRRIIEVGCGLGNLLRYLVEREMVIGIDTSSKAVTEMRREFGGFKNISIYEYSITDRSVLALQGMKLDSAVSLNVFEHIEDDELAMQHTALLLMPDSYFVLIVPAHPWLYGTMDRALGHYRRYTKASVKEKLEKSGFRVLRQKYINPLGAMGWFVSGRLLGSIVPSSWQLQVFNKVVPILKTVERFFTPPFGISLITIAQYKAKGSKATQ